MEQLKAASEFIDDNDAKEAKLRELKRRHNDADKQSDGAPPSKRSKTTKNKGGKTCKWCGSTTHSRKSSLQCPYNKKNQTVGAAADASAEAVGSAADADTSAEAVGAAAAASDEAVDSGSETEWEDDHFHALSDVEESQTQDEQPAQPAQQTVGAQPTQPAQNLKPGDNVTVTLASGTYLGHLTKNEGDRYHVYFVGNRQTEVLSAEQIAPDKWNARTREEYIDTEFYHDGQGEEDNDLPPIPPGRWKVSRIDEGSEYVCTRLSGGGATDTNSEENFDVGFVIEAVREEEEWVRERGPCCTGRR